MQLFPEADIPWQEIAFRTVSTTLRHYYTDRTAGAFACHSGEILPVPAVRVTRPRATAAAGAAFCARLRRVDWRPPMHLGGICFTIAPAARGAGRQFKTQR